jgi:hypothetical protein
MVVYEFKNGSRLDIIAARASSRGKRKHGTSKKYFLFPRTKMINPIIVFL